MTEVTASTIAILNTAQQNEIYNALFSPGGSNYTLTRTHIGSCDFALGTYTYDDNGDMPDPTLANFSIKYDMPYLIPGLKQAMAASAGSLKILGSMWTAPPWMKINPPMVYNDGSVNPIYYGALATYFSKYVQAYKAQGLNVWGITPANEPIGVITSREHEVWSNDGADMNTFVKGSLGPQFKTDGLATKIFIYDHNKNGISPTPPEIMWGTTLFKDPTTNPFLAGMAVHWYNSTYEVYESDLDALHAIDPTKDILFDEGTADGFIFKISTAQVHSTPWWQNDDWFWNINEYDWGYLYAATTIHPEYAPISRYARDIIVGLNHWYTGWIDWTAVVSRYGALDAPGGGVGTAAALPPEWSPPGPGTPGMLGNPGVGHIENGIPASIMVDEVPTMTGQMGTIYYTPIFYVMRQFSKYILPGATILTTTNSTAPGGDSTAPSGSCSPGDLAACTPTQTLYATAARNPDGTTAVVIFNSALAAVNYSVVVGSQSVTGAIPAQAIQTLVWQ
jgi:glucosylceramidase